MYDIVIGNSVELLKENIKIKELYGGFGQELRFMTIPQIAKLHVDNPIDKKEIQRKIERVNELINNNINNFKNYVDIMDLKLEQYNNDILLKLYNVQNSINRSKNLFILSSSGYCKLFNLFRIKNMDTKKEILEKYFKEKDTNIHSVIYKEISFLNKLKQSLSPLHIKGIKQYKVLSYKIDYYIPNLNISIEYDENNHKNYTYEQQELRQDLIEKELGCKFIRVSDEYSDEYNIGLVFRELFQIAC